ncbi:hypothetical protein LMH87_005045 [Akanthomyces muscarius]|uniref:Uncharacterized protein n=1 Tax=Akanthomyces muscarius TaxID=2231603 RepID=A0A9W8QND2_AKAMU|nr:hypothetical protein LMH87_005045 [Akanthomyces muscarius]KAJ4163307.1 hypothetical protein LMH87_005045 [Akanthomyces muscarius]
MLVRRPARQGLPDSPSPSSAHSHSLPAPLCVILICLRCEPDPHADKTWCTVWHARLAGGGPNPEPFRQSR